MSFATTLCPLLQESLSNIAGGNSVPLNRANTGLVDWMRSPVNRNGFRQITLSTEGKIKRTQIFWVPATCLDEIVDTPADLCAAGSVVEPQEDIIEVNEYAGAPIRELNEDEMRLLCAPGLESDQWRQQILGADINAVNSQIEINGLTFLAANVGNHFGTGLNAAVPVSLFNQTSGGVIPDFFGWSGVLEEYRNIRGLGRPGVIGDGLVSRYFTHLNYGCCNEAGVDLSQAGTNGFFFRSQYASTTLGTNEFLVLSPGTSQIITANYNVGNYARFGDTFAHTTVIDDFTGMMYDVDLEYISCNKVWRWRVGLHYSFWVMPSQYDCPTEGMDGTNGTLLFEAEQTCPTPCP